VVTTIAHLEQTGLVREPDPRAARVLEDDVLALQEDVAKDREANARVDLDATKARGAAILDGGVVDVLAGDTLLDAGESKRKVGQGSRAGEDVSSVRVAVGGARDLCVVSPDDSGGQVEERGARVSDAVDAGRDGRAGTDAVAREGELPEALGAVDVGVGDRTRVLGAVDVTKVVRTSSVVLEGGGKERLAQRALNCVEEGRLRRRADGVDGGKGQTEEAVGVNIVGELGRDRGSGLDSLPSGGGSTYGNLVCVDLAGSARSVTVGYSP
jgi:hypothetical protein